MLTVAEIKRKIIDFPNDRPVEELIDEIILMYKVQKGLQEADEGKGISWDEFRKEMDLWWKSK